jgi:integrase
VHEAVRRLHYSRRTEEAYVHWIKRFIFWSGRRHPATLGEAEVTAFLSHLAAERNVAAATQNQALAALLFLDKQVLGRELGWFDDLVRAKRPVRMPVVLSRGEVSALLAQMRGAPWLMASLLYGAGLRLMECLRLRVKDVDFAYRQITSRSALTSSICRSCSSKEFTFGIASCSSLWESMPREQSTSWGFAKAAPRTRRW